MLWIIIVGFALVAFMDLSPLIRRRKWHAIAAFASMFAVALTLAVLLSLNIEVPNTMYGYKILVRSLGLGYPP